MKPFDYQRLVQAYHGCDEATRDAVLRGGELKLSENDYDWLGHGIYFWEHAPARALRWAQQQTKRQKIQKPAVLGALIHLGHCFDFLDQGVTEVLADAHPEFVAELELLGIPTPINSPLDAKDSDLLIRRLDCGLINWTVERIEKNSGQIINSVRGLFQEGEPIFPTSGIRLRSHIQIAVRDPACIVGYFLPSL